MHGCRNVNHLVLGLVVARRIMFKCRRYLRVRTFPFLSDLASAIHYSFLALPSQYISVNTHHSLCALAKALVILYAA